MADEHPYSYLEGYLEELFKHFETERQRHEENWNYCYDAVRGNYSSSAIERWKKLEGVAWRSKVFFKITKVKTVAAVSQILDMLTRLPYDLRPTSRPEIAPGTFIPPELAAQRAKAMKTQIDDRLEEAKFQNHLGSGILECAIYGGSWLKAPVFRNTVEQAYQFMVPPMPGLEGVQFPPELVQQFGRHMPVKVQRLVPTIEHPSIWTMFWDPEAKSINEGRGVTERIPMSAGIMRRLQGVEGYDGAAIESVLQEHGKTTANSFTTGSGHPSEAPEMTKIGSRERFLKAREFWVRVPSKLLEKSEIAYTPDDVMDGDEVEIMTVMGEDRIILPPIVNPNNGKRIHHFTPWEDVPHEFMGVGVPENIRDSQVMLNGLIRAALDGKALATSPERVRNPKYLEPGQGNTSQPGQTIDVNAACEDVRRAFMWNVAPDTSIGAEVLINLFERWADQESGLPNLMHGETARFDPKTAFAFSKLLEAGSRQLGKIIRNIDQYTVEPIVQAFFEHEMLTNPDESIKGDYKIVATGFSHFRDKAQRAEGLQAIMTLALGNPTLTMMSKIAPMYRDLVSNMGHDPDAYILQEAEMIEQDAKIQMAVQQALAQVAGPPGQEMQGAE
ncbi:MAG: hypothetical protein V2A77_02740 [Pseudomonadota bacterium]